jgi:hypothetical protein
VEKRKRFRCERERGYDVTLPCTDLTHWENAKYLKTILGSYLSPHNTSLLFQSTSFVLLIPSSPIILISVEDALK